MSLFIDIKYLNQIRHRLPLFKQKSQYIWNCRCILCGDSSTKKSKARGYFYRQKTDIFYKCHNCSVSMHFGSFLKQLDPTIYGQYVFERYGAGMSGPKAHKNLEDLVTFEQPVFNTGVDITSVAHPLSALPDDNEAVAYCAQRGIPKNTFDRLFYLPHMVDIVRIAPKYEQSLKSDAPRLAMPFYTHEGVLSGVALRAMRGEAMRYINVKILEDAPLIFGLKHADFTTTVYVVEGPIDSLFLPNSIACAGTSFGKIEALDIDREKLVIVFDNQPRNAEVCALVEKYIDLNYRVCIWPGHIEEKDLNDMANAGINVREVVDTNVYSGLMAKVKFTEWRS